MVLASRRPRTVLGCLVACHDPVRLPGLGAGWLPGVSRGGRFPGCGRGCRGCPGSRGGWPCRLLRGGVVPCRAAPGPVAESAWAAIWTSRSRSLPVGMPATSRRKALPRLPREGRLPARSRPSARASAKSRSSITMARAPCCLAVAMMLVIAALSRPSRVAAGSPARSRPMVARVPRTLPSAATTAHGQVPGVDVDRHHRVPPQFLQGRRRCRGGLP